MYHSCAQILPLPPPPRAIVRSIKNSLTISFLRTRMLPMNNSSGSCTIQRAKTVILVVPNRAIHGPPDGLWRRGAGREGPARDGPFPPGERRRHLRQVRKVPGLLPHGARGASHAEQQRRYIANGTQVRAP